MPVKLASFAHHSSVDKLGIRNDRGTTLTRNSNKIDDRIWWLLGF